MNKLLLTSLMGITLQINVASATDINQEIVIPAKPEKVWQQISDFCSIQYWASKEVLKCTQFMKNGVYMRTLTMGDGSEIDEKLVDITDTSFSYRITKSVLPIKDHYASMTLNYQPNTGNTVLSWDIHMIVDSDAKTSEAIQAAFEQIMKDSLRTIKKKVTATH